MEDVHGGNNPVVLPHEVHSFHPRQQLERVHEEL